MFQCRQVLVRMRAGDSDREIARSGVMGRDKLAALRALARAQRWLEADGVVPDDEAIVAVVGRARRAPSTVSSVEPYRALVQRWLEAGVQGKAIHAALVREHGLRGSYSSVARLAAHQLPHVERLAPGGRAEAHLDVGPVGIHQVHLAARGQQHLPVGGADDAVVLYVLGH
ncbi:MAG: hypothetical protein ING74_06355, partial [Rhodocyclaceae bacterium]|nr:hypothetical protein [Rhodocyclaceae bacterium]